MGLRGIMSGMASRFLPGTSKPAKIALVKLSLMTKLPHI